MEADRQEKKIRDLVLDQIRGGLWHMTHPARFAQIIEDGAILVNPPVPDSDRWYTKGGSHYYPFVRYVGGVSLFDLRWFDEGAYTEKHPFSSWAGFIPYTSEWKCAAWIEIDPISIAAKFLDPAAVWERNLVEGHVGRRLMPDIEAAHLGDIPRSAFMRAFGVKQGQLSLDQIQI